MESEETRHRAGPLAILVADDDAVSRMVVAGLLRRGGHHVDTAIDGVEAVEAAARQHYDLILMDLQMPELDGIEAARRIRSSETSPRSIVALTATVDDDVRSRCTSAGFDAIAQKPLSAERVAEIFAGLSAGGEAVDDIERGDASSSLSAERFDRFRHDAGAHLSRPFGEIVDAMLGEMGSQLERLEAAAARGDLDGVAAAAHSLRGSSATIGAERLAGAMARLESEARSRTAAQLSGDVSSAREELALVARLVSVRMESANG